MSVVQKLAFASILALSAASCVARADVYTATTNFSGGFGEIGDGVNFTPQLFDVSKGNLIGVSLNFTGETASIVTGVPPYAPSSTTPTELEFKNDIRISGDGISYFGQLPNTYAPTQFSYSGEGINSEPVRFDLTFSTPQTYVADYTDCASCLLDNVSGAATVFDAATGHVYGPGGGSQDELTSAAGVVTETFTYTPVPEPGSLALLGTALAMLVGTITMKRRRS